MSLNMSLFPYNTYIYPSFHTWKGIQFGEEFGEFRKEFEEFEELKLKFEELKSWSLKSLKSLGSFVKQSLGLLFFVTKLPYKEDL